MTYVRFAVSWSSVVDSVEYGVSLYAVWYLVFVVSHRTYEVWYLVFVVLTTFCLPASIRYKTYPPTLEIKNANNIANNIRNEM